MNVRFSTRKRWSWNAHSDRELMTVPRWGKERTGGRLENRMTIGISGKSKQNEGFVYSLNLLKKYT
nr:hypothetical protein [Erwinia amylovora]